MRTQNSKTNLQFPLHMKTAKNHLAGFNLNRKRKLKQINTKLCSAKEENLLIAQQAGKKLKVNYNNGHDYLYELRTVHGSTLDMSPSLNFTLKEADKYVAINPKTNQQYRFVRLEIYRHENGMKKRFHVLPANGK